jgi:hypothetical protein
MNDHQPAPGFEFDADAETAPATSDGVAPVEAATKLHEPDFSRLHLARAALDRAFSRS